MRHCLVIFVVLLLIVGTLGLRIDCDFGVEDHVIGDVYTCKAVKLIVEGDDEIVEAIIGEHEAGMTDKDVKVLHVDDRIFKFFPSEVESFFPNLKGLKVVSSGLKALTKENLQYFPELEFVDFSDNEMEVLSGDLFAFNERLKIVSFDSNKISTIGEKIFDSLNELENVSLKNNECIDESWGTPQEIEAGKAKITEKCSDEKEDEEEVLPVQQLETDKKEEAGHEAESEHEFNGGETSMTRVTSINRQASRSNLNLNGVETQVETETESPEITCDFAEVYWKYSDKELYTCTIQTQSIEWSNYKIKVSQADSEKVQAVSFDGNTKMKYLPVNIAEAFPNLIELSAKNSYLESISSDNFHGLDKLKRISLTDNDLNVIEGGTFGGLTRLELLDLGDGDIRFIDETAFTGLSSLISLQLGANKLHFLGANTFKDLPNLQNISIELNHLTDLDDSLFSGNMKLKYIWLNGNKISILDPKAFEGLNDLAYVDLHGNECVDEVYETATFEAMKSTLEENCATDYTIQRTFRRYKVKTQGETVEEEEGVRSEYSIDNNQELFSFVQDVEVMEGEPVVAETTGSGEAKTEVPVIKNNPEDKTVTCDFEDVQWRSSESVLKTCVIRDQIIDAKGFKIVQPTDGSDIKAMVVLSSKNVKYLPENIAEVFPSLVEFAAPNSSLVLLSRKNFEGLSDLKFLNLANNNIKFIDPDTFDDMNDLEELDLSANGMEYIDENIFTRLKSLKTLRIADNKLHFIHPKIFRNLRSLQNISISSNALSTLDENLFKTNQKLTNIWLQNNKIKSMSPNMFNSARNLEYIDMRENKCIAGVYEESAFEAMKKEILDKCGEGYVLKSKTKKPQEKKTKPTKKKKKQKMKPEPEVEFKEVTCEYEDIFWPSLNETLYTCVVPSDQVIDEAGYTISVNAVPYNLPLINGDHVQALMFGGNKKVKFLPENIADAFPNLIAFSAAGSSIKNVPTPTFKKLPKLRLLDLSGNEIEILEPTTFDDLSSLEELLIDDNDYETFEETIITQIRTLKRIKFGGRKLREIHPEMFEILSELVEVSVDLEDPTTVSDDFFTPYDHLMSIIVNGKVIKNEIPNVDDHKPEVVTTSRSTTPEVTTENAGEEPREVSCNLVNQFSFHLEAEAELLTCEIPESEFIDRPGWTIKPSPELSGVKVFSIANNENIKYLPNNLAEVFTELLEIRALGSDLVGVNKKNLVGLKKLKILYLTENKIKHIEPDSFDDLESLDMLLLGLNEMEFLEEDLLNKLKHLRELDLRQNKLHYIHPKTFRPLGNLETLDIESNLLSVIEPSTFRYNQKLEKIDLRNNKIESLDPKTFDHLRGLKKVSLENNKCIDGEYDESNFDEMRKQIEENCVDKKVTCEFNAHDNSCTVNDQVIESSDYTIEVKSPDSSKVESSTVQHLIFRGPQIRHLPKTLSKLFPNLEELSAIDIELTSVGNEHFMNLPRLRTLKLSKVKHVESRAFDDLNHLENFDIELTNDDGNDRLNYNTDQNEIDDETFSRLFSTKTFRYTNNKLRKISPKWFENLSELTEVELNIPQIDEKYLEEVERIVLRKPKLRKFTINGNVIREEEEGEKEKPSTPTPDDDRLQPSRPTQQTPYDDRRQQTRKRPTKPKGPTPPPTTQNPQVRAVTCFLGYVDWPNTNKTLITCDLKDQTIDSETVIAPNPYSKYIEALRIDNNKNVKYLPENIAESFPNLVQLSAQNSSLEAVFPDDFTGLDKLTVLDLSGNKIESVEPETFANLVGLEALDLSDNKIDYIDGDAFPNLPNLKNLELNGNKITFLDPKTFDMLPELKELNLDGNYLPNIDEAELFKNNPRLERSKLIGHDTTTRRIATRPTHEQRRPQDTTRRPQEVTRRPQEVTRRPQVVTRRPQEVTRKPHDTTRRTFPTRTLPTRTPTRHETYNEVPCTFSDIYWFFTDSSLFTCDLQHFIDRPDISLKPTPRNNRVKGLNFIDNKDVKFLPQDIAKLLPNLIGISGFNSSLESIKPENFKDLEKVKYLNLAKNNLRVIEPETFKDLTALEELDLSDNKIYDLDESTFDNLRSLSTLYLGGNQLTKLPARIFENLSNLRNLSLENNYLTQLDPATFVNNPKLENVWINGNRIKDLTPTIFDGLSYLDYVDLQGNECIDQYFEGVRTAQLRIEIFKNCRGEKVKVEPVTFRPDTKPSIPRVQPTVDEQRHHETASVRPEQDGVICKGDYVEWVDSGSPVYTCTITQESFEPPNDVILPSPHDNHIQGLRIDGRQVKNLPRNIAQRFPNLVHLAITNTSLTSIKPGSISRIPKLKSLDLSDNQIVTISPDTFNDLSSLEKLNLNHNRIRSFDGRDLPSSLKTLNFGNNYLTSFEPNSLENLPELTSINLEGNNIYELPENLFNNNRKLEKIILNGNRIRNLSPKTFDNLPNLESLDLEENSCMSGYFNPSSFRAMKIEITRNCQQTEKENEAQPDEYDVVDGHDNTPARIDPNHSIEIINLKIVLCNFGDTYSTHSNSHLFTCDLETQPINTASHKIEDNPQNFRVKRMIVQDNKDLKLLPENIGESFPNLIELEVKNSSLKRVTPENFKNLPKLKILDLSDNDLKVVEPETFDDLESLEVLSLSRNSLKYVAESQLEQLKTFNLDGNKLSFLDSKAFSKLPELSKLSLESNQLTEVPQDLFSFNPKLEVINVRQNKIRSVKPEAFEALRSLATVDLSENDCINQEFNHAAIRTMKQVLSDSCQSTDNLNILFSTCKREREACRRSLTVKSNQNKSEHMKKENEKLRSIIDKSELKVGPMNAQIKKLRTAAGTEKAVVRKLKLKVKSLEIENENLKKATETCSRYDEMNNFNVDLECDFDVITNFDYTCNTKNIKVGIENSTIESVIGDHNRGKRNLDVTSLIVRDQSMKFLPDGLATSFPNLVKFVVENSKLSKIGKTGLRRLGSLKDLSVKGNNIREIEAGSFDDLPQLESLDMSHNHIHELPPKIFVKLLNLITINLGDNKLKTISADTMPQPNKLHEIIINHNHLETIDPRMLKRLKRSKFIDLRGNKCIDDKFSEADGDDQQSLMTLFGEVALKCSEDGFIFCGSK